MTTQPHNCCFVSTRKPGPSPLCSSQGGKAALAAFGPIPTSPPPAPHPRGALRLLPQPPLAPQVSKLVHAIKMGWIKPRKPKDDTPTYYDLWAHEDPNSILGRHKMHVPAPKMKLPGHEESYNPPPEYLLSEEEVRGDMGGHGELGGCGDPRGSVLGRDLERLLLGRAP